MKQSQTTFAPTYKNESLDNWIGRFSSPWKGEHERVFELYVMKELGLTQEGWDALPYWDRVEWLAYHVNENKKQAALSVDQQEQAEKNRRKK